MPNNYIDAQPIVYMSFVIVKYTNRLEASQWTQLVSIKFHPIIKIMIKTVLFGVTLFLAISCNKDDGEDSVKQENGNVWLSGGLAYCAEQIHLDNGDTLIVSLDEIISFKSGDQVTVKYKEIGINDFCPPSIDCEILEIIKID